LDLCATCELPGHSALRQRCLLQRWRSFEEAQLRDTTTVRGRNDSDEQRAFNAIVKVYETWRDKRLSRPEKSAALGALSSFIHEMEWTKSVQDELEERSRGRR
jgi:hypothetical protein